MAIKTFDADRVGGGTYQLEQDATTGEYKLKEVGFIKLPDLKLPEIDQAAYKIPDPFTPDPNKPDSGTDANTGSVSSGNGGNNQIDFTGATELRNIQNEATGDSANLMKQATTLSKQDIQVEDISTNETNRLALKDYNDAIANYRNLTSNIDRSNPNEMRSIEDAKNKLDRSRRIYEMTSGLDLEGTQTSQTIKDAPVGDFSDGPKTVPTGTLTGAKVEDIGKTFRSDTDKFKTRFDPTKIEPADTSNVLSKAKDVISNFKPVSLVVAEAVLGVNEVDEQRQKNAKSFFDNVSSKNYKTRGELGSSTDPGRLAGDPTVDLFAGMNKVSAKGNLEEAGAKRIDTRNNTIDRRGIKDKAYADANGLKYDPNGMSADFHRNTKGMEKELDDMRNHNNNENIKSAKNKGIDTSKLNPNEMRNVAETGDPGGDPGGKIVCTMMNQRYGFGSFRNKIWLKFHKDYSPEYQKGYHKVFLPLVNIAKKEGIFNTIVRKILEHMGRHVTADMFQVMRNKKSDKLGRIYRKIFEPICYWLGGK
jgi:hypothetical protein